MTYVLYFISFLCFAGMLYFGQVEPVLATVFLVTGIVCIMLSIIIDKLYLLEFSLRRVEMDHQCCNIHTSSSIIPELMGISNITDPEGAVYQIADRLYHPERGEPAAILVASDIVTEGCSTNTDRLFTHMENNKLGLYEYSTDRLFIRVENNKPILYEYCAATENPKTGDSTKICVFTIDHTAFKEWYKTERVKRFGKGGN